jgi:hypothetical protein
MFPPRPPESPDIRSINWNNAIGVPANSHLTIKFANDLGGRAHIIIKDGIPRYSTDGDATHVFIPPDHVQFLQLSSWIERADSIADLITGALVYIDDSKRGGLRKLRKEWPFAGQLVSKYGWPRDITEDPDLPVIGKTDMEEFERTYATGLLQREIDFNRCIVHWSYFLTALYYTK